MIDTDDKDMKYKRRYKKLTKILNNDTNYIKLVDTQHLSEINEDIAMYRMKCYIEDGYEGLIVRKSDNKYRSYRSSSIMKYKMFDKRDILIGTKITLYYSGETNDRKPEYIFNFKSREKWDI